MAVRWLTPLALSLPPLPHPPPPPHPPTSCTPTTTLTHPRYDHKTQTAAPGGDCPALERAVKALDLKITPPPPPDPPPTDLRGMPIPPPPPLSGPQREQAIKEKAEARRALVESALRAARALEAAAP